MLVEPTEEVTGSWWLHGGKHGLRLVGLGPVLPWWKWWSPGGWGWACPGQAQGMAILLACHYFLLLYLGPNRGPDYLGESCSGLTMSSWFSFILFPNFVPLPAAVARCACNQGLSAHSLFVPGNGIALLHQHNSEAGSRNLLHVHEFFLFAACRTSKGGFLGPNRVLLLCCVGLNMKTCWKQCKSWIPQGREQWHTWVSQPGVQQCTNDCMHSSPAKYSTIWVSILVFHPTFLLLFYSLVIAATCSQPPLWALHVAICSPSESHFGFSDQGPAGISHLCFMYLIYSECTKWQFIISLSWVKDIITSRNGKKVQPYVEMLYFVHF